MTNSDYFKMYGKLAKIPVISLEHMDPDGSTPDFIYVRPKWYLRYVNNLARLISTKYAMPYQNFNNILFNRMVNFAVSEQCTLKGIIDYEISKKLKKDYFFIPVFYSKQFVASLDAVFNTDYVELAKKVKDSTLKYLFITYGIPESSLKIEEIKRPWYNPIFNSKGISHLYSYKITVK